MADRLRRDRAVLHAGRAALPGARRARRGPDRAAGERAVPVPGGAATSRASSSSPTTSRRPGCHPFHAPCGVMLDEADMPDSALRALRDLRRLPVPRAREVRRRGARRAAGAGAPQRHAAHQRRGACGWRPTRPARRSPGCVVEHDGGAGDASRPTSSSSPAARRTPRSCCWRRRNDAHPHGLANGSDQVGRNYMFHNSQAVLALSKEPNPTVFQKTLGLNDFYFGTDDFDYPLGNIQMVGKSLGGDVPRREAAADQAGAGADAATNVARHAVDFWLSTEDLPAAGQPRHAARRRQHPARLHGDQRRARRSGCCTSSRRCSATSACTPTT